MIWTSSQVSAIEYDLLKRCIFYYERIFACVDFLLPNKLILSHDEPETMETHSGNTNSTDSYFQSLSFPPISTIGQLLGKSNFKVWRSSIEPVLLINPVSSKLILGEWSDARAIASSAVSEQERDEWHTATVATCRFIRATLALNVAPFVRQHNTAKALYLNLIWLYGPEAGIDTQGGPAISPGALMQNPRRTRAGLLAAMESKTPLGESTIPERPPYSHPRPHPHAQAQPQIRAANLGSGLSTTSLLMTTATTPSPSASTADLLRPESQVLPPEVKPVTVIASSVPPPPTVVHVYERMRASPDPSLQTIHEEPHPGTKVDVSRTVVATKTHDVSPVSSSGVSDGDNVSVPLGLTVASCPTHAYSAIGIDAWLKSSP